MSRKLVSALATIIAFTLGSHTAARQEETRTFAASGRDTLILDLQAGADVHISGTGGSSIVVDYRATCTPACEVTFEETREAVKVKTRFTERGNNQSSSVDIDIKVPSRMNVELDSSGGGIAIDGVEGEFTGQTAGGELVLRTVRGRAELKSAGGDITLTNADLEGTVETMGGDVRFENVSGDVKGKTAGGDVHIDNADSAGANTDVVQVSTMGGDIEVASAPVGAKLQTNGGDIEVRSARGFVMATTMGGDIEIGAVDGDLEATTMGGDVEAVLTGRGGQVTLSSMGGEIELVVPPGFGMDFDLEIAYTRNSKQDFRIDAPGGLRSTVTDDWDPAHGTPRKYIRQVGAVNGGGKPVVIKTINGNITVREAGR